MYEWSLSKKTRLVNWSLKLGKMVNCQTSDCSLHRQIKRGYMLQRVHSIFLWKQFISQDKLHCEKMLLILQIQPWQKRYRPLYRAVGTGQPGQPWGWPGFSSLTNSPTIFSKNVQMMVQFFTNAILFFPWKPFWTRLI